MPNNRKNLFYPTDPAEIERLSRHIAAHKYTDKELTLPCAVCEQTTPYAVAKLIENGQLTYAVRCSNCGTVAVIVGDGSIHT